jgi:stage III sporulation protein AE
MLSCIKRLGLLGLVLLALSVKAGAVDVDEKVRELTGTQALEEAAEALPDEISLTEGFNISEALDSIFGAALDKTKGLLKRALTGAALILICSYICSVVSSAYPDASGYVSLAGIAAVTVIFTVNDSGLIASAKETLYKLQDFANVLLPVLAAAAAASGEIVSSAVRYEAAALFFTVLVNIATFIILPLIYAFLAASVAEAASGSKALNGAVSLLKWLATITLTIIMLIFTLYLSIGSIVSGSADAAAVRIAKTTISTAFPLVGNIASDAASAILSSASVIKNTVGAFGLAAVLSLCIGPFVEVGLHYLIFKGASKLCAESDDSSLSKLISRFAEAFGITIAMTGATAVMMFFTIFSFVKVSIA